MPIELVAFDATAVRASIALVEQAGDEDWRRPSPCVGWTLHGLVAHMTTQHYGFAAASRGEGDLAPWKLRSLGDDPIAAYRASAEHMLAAFAEPDLLDRDFPLPEFGGDVPFRGEHAVGFHFIDYVVHSWDVAKTLGISVAFEPALLEAALPIAEAAPGGEIRTTPGAAFGPIVAAEGGSRLDDIVAMLGRSPNWPD